MRTDRRNRCDQIIELIDRCLTDCEAPCPSDASPSDEQSEQRAPVAA